MTAPTMPHTRLAIDIAEVVTNIHPSSGYWRLNSWKPDLPDVLADHLLAKGWRPPVDVDPLIAADRLVAAMDYEKRQSELEAVALQCVGEIGHHLPLDLIGCLSPTLAGRLRTALTVLDKTLPQIIRGRVRGAL